MREMTRELAVHDLNELKRNSYHGYADAIDFALSDMGKVPELEDCLIQRKADVALLRKELEKIAAERDAWKWGLDKITDAISNGDKVDKDTMFGIFDACQEALKEHDIGKIKDGSKPSDPHLWTPMTAELDELDR